MPRRWWDRYPDRYESEIAELEQANIRFERDEQAFAQGFLRLHVYPRVAGEELHLVATFPELYPHFKFEVDAPTLDLPRHQHGASRTLCLLPRGTLWWKPATDRLAHILRDQLPRVLNAATSDDREAYAGFEEEQAEPYTDYYTYELGWFILVDGNWKFPADLTSGWLTVGCEQIPRLEAGRVTPIRGAVHVVYNNDRNELARSAASLIDRFPNTFEVRWVRLAHPPKPADDLFATAEASDSLRRLPPSLRGGAQMWVRAALFPEEHAWRGSGRDLGDGWLFAVRLDAAVRKGSRRPVRGQSGKHVSKVGFLARTYRLGKSDYWKRIPELTSLGTKVIAIFGLGCLGSVSALEFARAGVNELRFFDFDVVEAGTIVRWPLGLSAIARLKAERLQTIINGEYPFTHVGAWGLRLGGLGRGEGDEDALAEMLSGTSLVYDATAEYGVQGYLGDFARRRGLPYVAVESTLGAWGGKVFRIVPDETTGCWECAQHHRLAEQLPSPRADEATGNIQPEGCANPTFTGANFDTAEVALMGVRAATSYLIAAEPDKQVSDIAVLNLRSPDRSRIPPEWHALPVNKHPSCITCAQRASA
jgi:hypothetical protein